MPSVVPDPVEELAQRESLGIKDRIEDNERSNPHECPKEYRKHWKYADDARPTTTMRPPALFRLSTNQGHSSHARQGADQKVQVGGL
tara:strand:- start:107633 stop:107893 length:261 start_codon:yes stop_codon:yes gene_type:complete